MEGRGEEGEGRRERERVRCTRADGHKKRYRLSFNQMCQSFDNNLLIVILTVDYSSQSSQAFSLEYKAFGK